MIFLEMSNRLSNIKFIENNRLTNMRILLKLTFMVFILTFTGSFFNFTSEQNQDWSQFRGPNRDGKSLEKDLMKEWPESGPEKIWTVTGIGEGRLW